jgi:hypothetical protein
MLKNGWGPAVAKANRPAYSGRWLNERDRVCVCLPWLLLYTARYVQIKLFPAVSGSSYSPPTLFRVHKNDLACFTGVLS